MIWGIVLFSARMYMLILEQVEAFFQGQKSVDDVARIIQNKATIYINEQK